MKNCLAGLLLLLFCLPLLFCGCAEQNTEAAVPYVNELFYDLSGKEGVVDLVMFRVGTADAMLVSTQNRNLLIDTGEKDDEDAQKILAYLKAQNVDTLDAVIVSNFLTDNIGGLEAIMKEIRVNSVIAPSYNATGHRYTKFLRTVVGGGAELYTVNEVCELAYDDLTIRFIPAKDPTVYDTEEDMSLVLSLTHGKNTFLLTSNIGEARIRELTETEKDTYTAVKLPDHGAMFADMEAFLLQYGPSYVLISDSALHGVSYDVMSLLAGYRIPYYRTKDAYVCIRSNGKSLNIQQK